MEQYVAGYAKGQALALKGLPFINLSKLRSEEFKRGFSEGYLFYLMGV